MKSGRTSDIANALDLSPSLISPRLRGRIRFTVEEFGVIADEARAPAGWPFIAWEEAVRLDREYRGPRTLPFPPALDPPLRRSKPIPPAPRTKNKPKTKRSGN
jgi:hypothetical protein